MKSINYHKTILFLGAIVFLLGSCASIPKLSKTDKKIIENVLKSPNNEVITSETDFATNQKQTIWYERINPKTVPLGTILLIMGNGQDALSWPPNFISNLTNAGYQVIRYDHRETGLSTSTEKWKKKKAYSLKDMAQDAIAILDTLSIEKSHIVGVSMGGMIAQIIALEYPERTQTLTSIMSSGNPLDSEIEPMSNNVLPQMVSAVLKHGFFGSKKGQIKRQIIQKRILMGAATGEIDTKTIAQIAAYNLKKRTGYNLLAAKHHYNAILISESRLEKLNHLTIPTLIIHGKEDPVMPISHGEKLKKIIPNSSSLWVDNMGHDLPDAQTKKITDKLITHLKSQ